MSRSTDASVLAYAAKHNPCCAGCDHWRYVNSVAGECIRTAPVAGTDRVGLLGVEWTSAIVGPGHIMTPRGHACGEFADDPVSTVRATHTLAGAGAQEPTP